jgi:hypothetical protein
VTEPLGVVPDQVLSVQAVEVVAAELSVGSAVPEEVPRRDEDRIADGHDGFLVAAPARDPVILRSQVAAARPRRQRGLALGAPDAAGFAPSAIGRWGRITMPVTGSGDGQAVAARL